jgi:recombination protein RecA
MGSFPLGSEALLSPCVPSLLGRPGAQPLGLEAIDAVLPDGGLPRGCVVEIASPAGLARATQLALAFCAAAQRRARRAATAPSAPRALGTAAGNDGWCAWVDASATLFAPGVSRAGVDLDRLLVVRPEPADTAKVAVRIAASRALAVVVVDRSGVPGAALHLGAEGQRIRWDIAVRRLALAVQDADSTVVLLSSLAQAQAVPLPVALRLELLRPELDRLGLRVTKERYGRTGGYHLISLAKAQP